MMETSVVRILLAVEKANGYERRRLRNRGFMDEDGVLTERGHGAREALLYAIQLSPDVWDGIRRGHTERKPDLRRVK